jgi:hypothetical protein
MSMSAPGYDIVEWRQTWRIINGRYWRDCVARRLSDGELRLISVLDES